MISVTRWLDNFFNIWPFAKTKIRHNYIKVCQIRFKSLPNITNPQKIAQYFENFAKEVEFIQIWSH